MTILNRTRINYLDQMRSLKLTKLRTRKKTTGAYDKELDPYEDFEVRSKVRYDSILKAYALSNLHLSTRKNVMTKGLARNRGKSRRMQSVNLDET